MRFQHRRFWSREQNNVSAAPQPEGSSVRTLASVKPGCEVLVTGYGHLSGGQRQHLQAYGLVPGRRVRVIAQQPVTIVQVEETELAFEGGIAAGVLVGD